MISKQVLNLPLLHDNHSHASLYAVLATMPDMSALNHDQCMRFLESLPENELTIVRGWRTSELVLTAADLLRLPPVLLINYSLHGFCLSEKAIPFVGKRLPAVAENASNQKWQESHLAEVFAAYCSFGTIGKEQFESLLTALEGEGIGSTDDMAVCTAGLANIITYSGLGNRVGFWASPEVYKELGTEAKKICIGIKLFLDGSIGSMSAAIQGSWPDGSNGLLTYTDDSLATILTEFAGNKTGLAVHAIGELAIDQFLRVLLQLDAANIDFPYVQMEHVQFITKEQMRLCRDLEITLSMQPNFSDDSVVYADRLSETHRRHNNPFRKLIDRWGFKPGENLIFGSDGMPHSIAFALQCSLFPAFPDQKLSLEEFVAGYGEAESTKGKQAHYEIDKEAHMVRMTQKS